jgi:hypothetical protein
MIQFWKTLALSAAAAVLAVAQTASTTRLEVKSQKEADAVNAVFSAAGPEARIKAADALLEQFRDTTFGPIAMFIATQSAMDLNDPERVIIYGERAVKMDPKNYGSMLIMARTIALKTKEFDFDKEEKLNQATKYAKDAMALVTTASKMNPQLTDEQWEVQRKDFLSQGHEALALAASVRKKHDEAVTEFQQSVDKAMNADPSTMVRLAAAQNNAGKHSDAIATVAKIMATANLHEAVKAAATAEKEKAEKAKK